VTFTTRRATCPPVHINDVQIPQENHVKYLGLILTDDLPGTHTFLQNANNLESPSPNVLVTTTQVQTLYQQQTPHLQSNTQTHLDVWHSNLRHDLKFQHRNFGTFSVESLASISECPLVHAKLSHPQGPPNTFSKRRNQPLQLPLRCSPPCTPQ
jgi:hypothetical protein